jgi:hypothetical protein
MFLTLHHKLCCRPRGGGGGWGVVWGVRQPYTDIDFLVPPFFQLESGREATRVADPDTDPNWIRIQSGQWIRIQEGKNDTKSRKNLTISSFEVLYGLF